MVTKDGVTPDPEDSSLTPKQAELLARLEGLFRELPPARQRALLRKLPSEETSQTAEGPGGLSHRETTPAKAENTGFLSPWRFLEFFFAKLLQADTPNELRKFKGFRAGASGAESLILTCSPSIGLRSARLLQLAPVVNGLFRFGDTKWLQ